MSLEQEVELIRQMPIFAKIPAAMQKLLCFGSERLVYDAGQTIVREGDAADAVYVLIEGVGTVTVSSPDGAIVVNTMGRNEVIGETAIFGDVPRTATVTATSRVEALKISKELFISIVRQNPDAAVELLRILSTRLANTTRQLTQKFAARK